MFPLHWTESKYETSYWHVSGLNSIWGNLHIHIYISQSPNAAIEDIQIIMWDIPWSNYSPLSSFLCLYLSHHSFPLTLPFYLFCPFNSHPFLCTKTLSFLPPSPSQFLQFSLSDQDSFLSYPSIPHFLLCTLFILSSLLSHDWIFRK